MKEIDQGLGRRQCTRTGDEVVASGPQHHARDASLPDQFEKLWIGRRAAKTNQEDLPDPFFDRHGTQQVFRRIRRWRGVHADRGQDPQEQNGCQDESVHFAGQYNALTVCRLDAAIAVSWTNNSAGVLWLSPRLRTGTWPVPVRTSRFSMTTAGACLATKNVMSVSKSIWRARLQPSCR